MPIKRRLWKAKVYRITPELVELWVRLKAIREAGEHEEFEPDGRRRDYLDGMRELQRAFALRPWMASPIDVREGEPAPQNPSLYAESWPEALEMRRELEAAIGIRPRN